MPFGKVGTDQRMPRKYTCALGKMNDWVNTCFYKGHTYRMMGRPETGRLIDIDYRANTLPHGTKVRRCPQHNDGGVILELSV